MCFSLPVYLLSCDTVCVCVFLLERVQERRLDTDHHDHAQRGDVTSALVAAERHAVGPCMSIVFNIFHTLSAIFIICYDIMILMIFFTFTRSALSELPKSSALHKECVQRPVLLGTNASGNLCY